MNDTITLDALQVELSSDNPPILVEALGRQQYENAHLPGAINIPHTQLDKLAPALLPDRDAAVVVYCADTPCPYSGIVTRRLHSLGYTNVRDFEAGKAEWIEAGLPTDSGVVAA